MVKIVTLCPGAKLLLPVNVVNAPPSALPDTLEVGMLCPAPSVNAAVVLLVNAYNVIVNGGIEMTHDVVILITESPLATPLRGSVKLTLEGDADTERVWPCALLQMGPARHSAAMTQ